MAPLAGGEAKVVAAATGAAEGQQRDGRGRSVHFNVDVF